MRMNKKLVIYMTKSSGKLTVWIQR